MSMLCKAWIWMYEKVFRQERFRRWKGELRYPFYCPQFEAWFIVPHHQLLNSGNLLSDFYSCCEHWFETVCLNTVFQIVGGLPHSGEGGLGLVCEQNCFLYDLYEDISGVLEFVTQEMFIVLQDNGFTSLYETREHDFCILFGAVSLCNNGSLLGQYWPSLIDRSYMGDNELEYHGLRRAYTVFPHTFQNVPFTHFSVRMHITEVKRVSVGDQIYVNYLADNFIDLTSV